MNLRDDQSDDENLEALLRQVGTRDEPSQEVRDSIRVAVHAQWRETVEQARRARRRWMMAVAASVLGILFAVGLVFNVVLAPAADIATVAYVDGKVVAQDQMAASGHILKGHDSIHTAAGSHALINIGADLSLRMDADTAVKLVAADRVVLERGALYVDSRGRAPLFVETAAGTVRHLGTQYQVRSLENGVDVSVREGRVEIRNTRGSNTANAGERLHVTAQGDVSRAQLARSDASWAWVAQAAPVPDIENQTLANFLDWIASETGRELIYATPAVRELAHSIKLHGSIRGLDLDTALNVVLQTTELRRDQAKDEVIVITSAAAGDSGNPAGHTL